MIWRIEKILEPLSPLLFISGYNFDNGIIKGRMLLDTLLVIDNYDSFTFNLVQMFMKYELSIQVHRCDMITLDDIEGINPAYVLISPGPKDPVHAGISISLIKRFYTRIPILGVCLGMQCINEAFGGTTVRAPLPIHGKRSEIHHNQTFIFKGVPIPFSAARYHSLMAKAKDRNDLVVTARSRDGVIMGLSHPFYPLHGVQFHPESFMTPNGFFFVENFLNLGPINNSSFAPIKRRKVFMDGSP